VIYIVIVNDYGRSLSACTIGKHFELFWESRNFVSNAVRFLQKGQVRVFLNYNLIQIVCCCECYRLNCGHVICFRLFNLLFRCAKLVYLLLKVTTINGLYSVYVLLTRLASVDSPYSMRNDSHLFFPSCCTGCKSHSLYICADLLVLCSADVCGLLNTKTRFLIPSILTSMVILAALTAALIYDNLYNFFRLTTAKLV
jgi:hypothetical protein